MEIKFKLHANEKWDLTNPYERSSAAKGCLENANGFINYAASAYSASMIKRKYPSLTETKDIDEDIPFQTQIFVNLALAIELFFKALILSKKPNKVWTDDDVERLKTHDLAKLYFMLDGKQQNGIYDLFIPVPSVKDKSEFRLTLEENSRAFECLRYVHEWKGTAPAVLFIYSLSSATANYVNNALGWNPPAKVNNLSF